MSIGARLLLVLGGLGAVLGAATVSAASPRLALRLDLQIVSPGERVTVYTSRPPARPVRLYVVARSAARTVRSRRDRRLRFVGVLLPDRISANFVVPTLAPGDYAFAGWCARCVRSFFVLRAPLLTVRGPGPTLPPPGFGALGAPGCSPASPRDGSAEVFGTATRAQFWGLFAFNPSGAGWGSGDAAVLDGIAGKEVKIVFKMTGSGASTFYAVAPDGTRTKPVWGPQGHIGSTWQRPGSEWGAGFVFSQPGCWQIHSGLGTAVGDIWLLVRS